MAPVHIPLDELALDGDAQQVVLRRLGLRPERDGRKLSAELCRTRALDPGTVMRVLAIIGEPAVEEDVPELVSLPELCERWERRHHGRLKSELAIGCARSDEPPGRYRLRRALEHLQTLLHAQIFREQRWKFPRLVASAPMT